MKYNNEILTRKELKNEVYQGEHLPVLETTKNRFHSPVFKGFHYFTARDIINIYDANSSYIINKSDEGTTPHNITGVLKIGKFDNPVKDGLYTGICFIDVREDFKRKGIATSMLHTLNDILTDSDILINSRLSEEGKVANINQVVSNIITACPFYINDIEYSKAFREAKN